MRKTLSSVMVMSLFFSLFFTLGASAAPDATQPGMAPEALVSEPLRLPDSEVVTELTRAESDLDTAKLKSHPVEATLNLDSARVASTVQEGLTADPQALNSMTATASTYTYTGYIEQEGNSSFLYPIYVDPGSILQAQLDVPPSAQLDYDLYLYEFDMSTGELNPNPIDYSIYGTYLNNNKTLSENVGTGNTAPYAKAYMLEVHGAVGASINEPFYLTVSTSSTYDAYETDENALHAYPFTVAPGGSTLASRSINSEIDQDWYTITVPESRNYDAMHISLDQASVGSGYKAELYGALSGNRMVLVPAQNGNVSLGTGTYYLRVYTTGTYSDANYSLHLRPVLRADKIVITGYNSDGGPNDYPSYAYGRYYRITGRTFTVSGVVTTSDNYAVANTEVDVTWVNDYWSESSNNRYRSARAITNSNGQFSVTLSLPASTGSLSQYIPGAIGFTHYYDLCGVVASVTSRSNVYSTDVVYHFAYSIYGG